jgi:glucokinase
VALPGFLDPQRSRVVYLSNVPALNGVDLKARLERRLSLPVVLDTDTNAGAVAEAHLGAGVGHRRVLYLTLGTGVGAALVVDGAPVRVSRHTVGHVAHVPLDPRGPRCRCGRVGCTEAVLSAGGILWRARRHGLRRIQTTEALGHLAHDPRADPSGRTAARAVWRETGEALGRLCVTLGSLLHPDGIVVGGGVAGAAVDFLPAARRHLDRQLTPRVGHSVSLDAAATGRKAGAVGAALLARADP